MDTAVMKWMLLAFMLVLLCIIFLALPCQAFSKKEVIKKEKNPAYQASVIDAEIQTLKQDIAWLQSKIDRFNKQKRFVPERFYTSMALKKKRLKGLEHLKAEYRKMIKPKPASPLKKTKTPKVLKPKTSSKKAAKTASFETKQQLLKKIKKSGLLEWVDVVQDQDLLKIENSLPILFASGSAAIAKEYQAFFKSLADLVRSYDVRIIVEGYADKDPIHTKQFPSNFELGAARAANVVHELVKHGIKPQVFKIGSTGEHRFASQKPSNWKALERFVDITILFRS